MTTVSFEQLDKNIPELIAEVSRGEHVRITKDNKPFAEVVPVARPQARPVFGSHRGRIRMAEDFDAPPEGFKDYLE